MPLSSSSTKSSPMNFSNPPIRPPPIMGPIMPTHTSFTQNVKDGFSVGLGVSIANRVVHSIFGSSSPAPTQKSCEQLANHYNSCIVEKRSVDECTKIVETLNECYKKDKNR